MPKVADLVEQSHVSKSSYLWPGSRAPKQALQAFKWALQAFGFLMLKYAFSHILETLFLLFLTSTSTQKADKNRTLDCTSMNLRLVKNRSIM